MSQEAVYKILQDLGGEATTGQISKIAKERFPKSSLHWYVTNRLNKLVKWKKVKKIKRGLWKIIQKEEGKIKVK